MATRKRRTPRKGLDARGRGAILRGMRSESLPPAAAGDVRMRPAARAALLFVLALLVAGFSWDRGWLVPPATGAGVGAVSGFGSGGPEGPEVRPDLVVAGTATVGIGWPDEAAALVRRVVPEGTNLAGRWKYIVFHHSATLAGGAQAFDAYHRKKFKDKNGVEYQFVIGNGTHTPDGSIEATTRWGKQIRSGHVKNPSRVPDSIAICVVGDFTKQDLSPAQFQACVLLARTLMNECGIPSSRITMHRAVDGARHTECPGGRFPLDRIKDALGR